MADERWEYRLLEIEWSEPFDTTPEALQRAGTEGWEAITAQAQPLIDPEANPIGASVYRLVVLLKRRAAAPPGGGYRFRSERGI